ncbi:hypothetical protein KDA_06620 [Dictyobacter alpinus]|uniref:Glycoside hydrolase n=1 Tax=Dictyobacter alpinus TaxID=2014873 RepID=A0A402B1G4_9CHLR|nr:DUF5054 domain-containing protein [Dictyobacter alpinus]GCE25178.1 hypothetical protein KDA_06620 [Dictyobacter alpinus]
MLVNSPEYIHLIFKTHLDLGFTDLAKNVAEQYFTHYIPQALTTAKRFRAEGSAERFIWTLGSWLIYEYLEQASPKERAVLEEAIVAGDIVWHGLPFTTHSELMDSSLFVHGLSLSQSLDRRFGKKTIAAKMTDVPGHTRAMVPLLAQAGIVLLHIGVNPASIVPDVPPVFVWRDPRGAEVIVVYQAGAYGGLTTVSGTTAALAFAHTNDNIGPQSYEQVQQVYREWHTQFPDTAIQASTLDAFAHAIFPYKDTLPVITQEIGDTWIHGIGTDPAKVAQFRELSRLRRQWSGNGQFKENAKKFERFSTALLLIPEHTWGLDEKEHLNDYTHYQKEQLALLRTQPHTQHFEASWQEQRNYIQDALQALGGTSVAQEAHWRLAQLVPQPFDSTGFVAVEDWEQVFTTAHFTLSFARSGSLNLLKERTSGRVWSSQEHQLGLFHYETFAASDYKRYWEQYCINKEETSSWSLKDFTKPGLDQTAPKHLIWQPVITNFRWKQDAEGYAFLLDLSLPAECSSSWGGPARLSLLINALHADTQLTFTLQWFEKPASRLPEALWFSFSPVVSYEEGWLLEKMGQWISPLDVITNGNRHLHAVGRGVMYKTSEEELLLETQDAALVAPGQPSLLDFTQQQPSMLQGMHFNLFNNIWGTNFPMWYEDDARFRFTLAIQSPDSKV